MRHITVAGREPAQGVALYLKGSVVTITPVEEPLGRRWRKPKDSRPKGLGWRFVPSVDNGTGYLEANSYDGYDVNNPPKEKVVTFQNPGV